VEVDDSQASFLSAQRQRGAVWAVMSEAAAADTQGATHCAVDIPSMPTLLDLAAGRLGEEQSPLSPVPAASPVGADGEEEAEVEGEAGGGGAHGAHEGTGKLLEAHTQPRNTEGPTRPPNPSTTAGTAATPTGAAETRARAGTTATPRRGRGRGRGSGMGRSVQSRGKVDHKVSITPITPSRMDQYYRSLDKGEQ
jgi:hypothetical protein